MSTFQSLILEFDESTSETLAFFLLLFFPPEGKHLLKYFKVLLLLFLSKPVLCEVFRGGLLFSCSPLITALEWKLQ